ncbi:hypothetical protein BJV78DRAFT_1246393 [Lactifluus subvellereus]|nr:hypothetical protein BJV78DRAFT_1246393 [Lactifluus subvellereus]
MSPSKGDDGFDRGVVLCLCLLHTWGIQSRTSRTRAVITKSPGSAAIDRYAPILPCLLCS